MSPTSPTAATQTFSATIKNKYMSTMRSKKNVPKISDRQRLGTRKAQYVGMVILACVQMVGSKLSILSFFHLVNFSERLEQAMVIQATRKKKRSSPKRKSNLRQSRRSPTEPRETSGRYSDRRFI